MKRSHSESVDLFWAISLLRKERNIQFGEQLRFQALQLREKKGYLARLETIDSGKPIDETEWDLDDCAGAALFSRRAPSAFLYLHVSLPY